MTAGIPGKGDRVAGKVALVAGAGSIGPGWGNGKAAAVLYAREGAKVFAVDNRLEAVEETRTIIEDARGVCAAHRADVTDEREVAAMVAACVEKFGGIDILHNNVGGSGPGAAILETDLDDWNAVLARNVTAAFMTIKAVLPHMERQGGGAIVNISSIAGISHIGVPSTAYSAAKGALNQLTQNIAVEYAARNIRANCVAPGLMDTPFILREKDGVPNHVRKGYATVEEYHAARSAKIPMRRMGDGWDVARAALFLASEDAAYITGQCLAVDGGVTATSPGA